MWCMRPNSSSYHSRILRLLHNSWKTEHRISCQVCQKTWWHFGSVLDGVLAREGLRWPLCFSSTGGILMKRRRRKLNGRKGLLKRWDDGKQPWTHLEHTALNVPGCQPTQTPTGQLLLQPPIRPFQHHLTTFLLSYYYVYVSRHQSMEAYGDLCTSTFHMSTTSTDFGSCLSTY